MSDDLDELKSALDAATPAPDPAKKAEHLALAQKNFAALQESRRGARPTSDRPEKGLFRGVARMFSTVSTKGALVATTAVATIAIVMLAPQWTQVPDFAPAPAPVSAPAPAPIPATPQKLELAEPEAVDGIARSMAEAPVATPAPAVTGFVAADRAFRRKVYEETGPRVMPDTESYPDAEPNALKVTAEDPVSTFSIDVDTASYAIVRSSLTAGQMPPEGAVRIEEMINYFPYDYPAPDADGAPFRPTVTVMPTPWNEGTRLVHIAIQGRKPVVDGRPPLNLVFLVDTSGSMQGADKLALLKQSLALMLPRLDERDEVAIIAYAGSAGQVLEPTPATDRAAILAALDNLSAGGATAGQAGLQQAYALAATMGGEGEVTRVILATDGDFNVGLSDPEALERFIADKRDSGIYLSVMGFGRGNLDDATMQALAQNGNGQAAYIDTLSEAQKVLVDQFSGALFPIANDVKIQVEFNPATVSEYRLIGYETRILRREDFNNDKVDAGDIGAGHSVTAIYEITPAGSDARLTEPLRYGDARTGGDSDEIGFLKIRYKEPGEAQSRLIETPIREGGTPADDMRFAAAIAGFGQLLSDDRYLGDWGYGEAIALAASAKGEDPFGYRAEAVRLMRLAQSLSAR